MKILKKNEKDAEEEMKKKEVQTVPTQKINTYDWSSDDEDHLVIAGKNTYYSRARLISTMMVPLAL